MHSRFRDRFHAGKELATRLTPYANHANALVLGLPRGGVPVAYEIAKALHLPLDICLVRKLGVPGHRELAMGAIASGGVRILNYDVISSMALSDKILEYVTALELRELQRREQSYRDDRLQPEICDRTIILVDDGLATGATMRAAIAVLQKQDPKDLIVAVPVASLESCQAIEAEVDKVVCLSTPEPFYAIGFWYENFDQTTDDQVRTLLAKQLTTA
ncbi:MAG: phosphoribosyltransferase [Cyanobacteria bacterium P01_F01_bin.116]